MTTAKTDKPKWSHKKKDPAQQPIEKTIEVPKLVPDDERVILAKYTFTEKENVTNGQELGRITQEINGLKDTAKSIASDHKTRLEMKEASRTAIANKLAAGHEYREVKALVIFRPKDRKADYIHPVTNELIEIRDMTETDFQLQLFKEEKKKKEAEEAKPKTPIGETNVGSAIDQAVLEAAKQQKRVEVDLPTAAEFGESTDDLIRIWKKGTSEWPSNIVVSIVKLAKEKAKSGTGALLEFLQPFCVQS